MLAPTYPLRTQRLDLRPYEETDLPVVRAMFTDPGVMRWLYPEPLTEEELPERLAQKIARRDFMAEADGINLLGVRRDTGEPVVDLALQWVSDIHRSGEVGYIVVPGHEGNGYATEGTQEMLRLGFVDAGFHRIVGRLEARNAASAAVLERLGMRREATLVENEWVKGEWQSETVYALLEAEWSASSSSA